MTTRHPSPSVITLILEIVPGAASATPKKKWKTGNDCIDYILNGECFYEPLLKNPRLPEIREQWRAQLRAAIQTPPTERGLSSAFLTQWHVCHYLLRELVDDDDLLFDFMWAWLPKYDGAIQVLYRGENIDRFQAGKLGSAWSDRQETANRFAQGLNAVGQGGMILRATVPASLIIAGPSAHSIEMGESEFSVDTRKLTGIAIIETFPPAMALT